MLTSILLRRFHKSLMEDGDATEREEDDACLQNITEVIADAMKGAANESRTGRLWINYLEQVSLLRLFIRAERTGDWDLHLYCVSRMIPFFHAAGHLPTQSQPDYTCTK